MKLLEEGRLCKREPETVNKIAVSVYLSIITLNVNDLHSPIERRRMAEWIKI